MTRPTALAGPAAPPTPAPPPPRPRARRVDIEAFLGWQPADPETAWERRRVLA